MLQNTETKQNEFNGYIDKGDYHGLTSFLEKKDSLPVDAQILQKAYARVLALGEVGDPTFTEAFQCFGLLCEQYPKEQRNGSIKELGNIEIPKLPLFTSLAELKDKNGDDFFSELQKLHKAGISLDKVDNHEMAFSTESFKDDKAFNGAYNAVHKNSVVWDSKENAEKHVTQLILANCGVKNPDTVAGSNEASSVKKIAHQILDGALRDGFQYGKQAITEDQLGKINTAVSSKVRELRTQAALPPSRIPFVGKITAAKLPPDKQRELLNKSVQQEKGDAAAWKKAVLKAADREHAGRFSKMGQGLKDYIAKGPIEKVKKNESNAMAWGGAMLIAMMVCPLLSYYCAFKFFQELSKTSIGKLGGGLAKRAAVAGAALCTGVGFVAHKAFNRKNAKSWEEFKKGSLLELVNKEPPKGSEKADKVGYQPHNLTREELSTGQVTQPKEPIIPPQKLQPKELRPQQDKQERISKLKEDVEKIGKIIQNSKNMGDNKYKGQGKAQEWPQYKPQQRGSRSL